MAGKPACIAEMSGVHFDLPTEAPDLVLEPFRDEARSFSGLVPVGWEELAPANMARKTNALDPTYFVLESMPSTAAELFRKLAGQLGLDPETAPDRETQAGHFTWDLYTFEQRDNVADLAMAADDRAVDVTPFSTGTRV